MKNKERFWQTTIAIAVEPRCYFWDKQQNWGTVFAALPVSVELGPFENNVYNIFEIPTIRAINNFDYLFGIRSGISF